MNSGLTERQHRAHLGGLRVVSRTPLGLLGPAAVPVGGRRVSLELSARGPGTRSVSSLTTPRLGAVAISISSWLALVAVVDPCLSMLRRAREQTQCRSATTGAAEKDYRWRSALWRV